MARTITEFEKKTYNYIKEQKDVHISNIPKMMWGAIPNLRNAGLVRTHKKTTAPWAQKKHTFVKIIEETNKKL
ncbi:MAG: hypothetical protein IAX21_02875 [Candidatus Bathyarchaeota archaeon]|nr:hypothetical protein [Candidatus Bathyarchaeum tardum]WGM90040.1 MAG: hypothetical protein NUK63_02670 [Candidatus Bathyarchaeum tardum]WNZ29818.1 MAG: hypothetical protein IAX21_02875 [Candidatus Bathyarchaeota archaeon]